MEKDLYVTCSHGLEPLLQQELQELGITQTHPGYRGVYVKDTSMEAIYRINYCSRLAGRVLLPLASFRCRDKYGLSRGVGSIDWLRYIPKGATFAIDSNVSHRELRNSLFAAQIAKDAICDQFRAKTGSRPNIDLKDPDVQLNLYINHDLAVMSYDTSRIPLYKRGYRQTSVEAPLQESLAAALLRLASYRGDEIVFDPCCGSGTLLIEAALMATHTPPGYLRTKWGFLLLPDFSQEEWLKVKNEVDDKRTSLPKGLIGGTDINKSAVQACKVNLRAAGFHQSIDVVQYDFRDYTPKIPPNFLITNPPHGRRLEEVDTLKPLYRALGDFMKQHLVKGGHGYVFTGDLDLSKEVGLAASRRHVLDNAGIESRLLEFEVF